MKTFFKALNEGHFDVADELLANGDDINHLHYKSWFATDIGEGHYENEKDSYLELSFASHRLDIAEYLLSRNAYLGNSFKNIINQLQSASTQYAYDSMMLLSKYNGSRFVSAIINKEDENLFHLLSAMRPSLPHKSDPDNFFSATSASRQYALVFGFTQEQLQNILNAFNVTLAVLTKKNKNGDTPQQKAAKAGNDFLADLLEKKQNMLLPTVSNNVSTLHSSFATNAPVASSMKRLGAN